MDHKITKVGLFISADYLGNYYKAKMETREAKKKKENEDKDKEKETNNKMKKYEGEDAKNIIKFNLLNRKFTPEDFSL